MSSSEANIESLARQAEAALERSSDSDNATVISNVLKEIQSAMSESAESRTVLGPLIGKLQAVQNAAAASPLTWVPLLSGHLAIGHRPKIKTIRNMRGLSVTHVFTLLSESEGAKDIGREVRAAGLRWIWLPLKSAEPPSEARRAEILQRFEEVHEALVHRAKVYVHCSAGIHRTGMITYAFLRYCGFSPEDTMATLSTLRHDTAAGVGDERKRWGEHFAGSR